ncbi:hypothetical protein F8M41_019126 [Gigaspora margarita]|uniref:Deoxynucleoside kinase domain-containing protein n=1 Tax=Gigaspora margarita TaxID=4874 RepID=A0A8H4EKR7_GIGMA|nr:hypothetical protein F8M41_019126 [Gigaspora margarita]
MYKKIIDDIADNLLKWDGDIIIFNQLHFNQKYFTNMMIKHKKSKEYLFDLIKQVNFDLLMVDKVIYVKFTKKIIIQRQKDRKASHYPWKVNEEQYFIDIFDEYEHSINKIYPDHVVFNSNIYLYDHCLNYQNDNCKERYNF